MFSRGLSVTSNRGTYHRVLNICYCVRISAVCIEFFYSFYITVFVLKNKLILILILIFKSESCSIKRSFGHLICLKFALH